MRFAPPSRLHQLALQAAMLLALPSTVLAQAHDHAGMGMMAMSPQEAEAAAVVAAFHQALQAGDTAAVLRLLGDDVLVAESGGLETRGEYLAHHLPGDMAFAAAVTREAAEPHVTVQGDVAWVMSTSKTSGTFRDRTINSVGAELMVLSRGEGGWQIRAIHWSSRQAR